MSGEQDHSGDRRWVIGVDGGGTKTEAVLAPVQSDDASLRIVATSVTGPSNLQRQAFDSSLSAVEAALEDLLGRHPETRGRIAAGCFAMAGSGNETLKGRFENWVQAQGWMPRMRVTHDARPLIAAGTTRDIGIALIAGTGSFAFAHGPQGREARCGGWGGLIGDEGSAYWLALQAFRHGAYAVDGRGPATCLVDDLGLWIGQSDPDQWPWRLSAMDPHKIASAASVVTRAAAQGDSVANMLLARAAGHLARMIQTLARGWPAEEPLEIAVAGGLICGCEPLRRMMLERLHGEGRDVSRLTAVEHPAHGSARLAMALLHAEELARRKEKP